MDPITLAIVAALAGGLAGGVAEGTVGSAYNALKDSLKRKHGHDSKLVQAVNALEEEPDFEPNQKILAERIKQINTAQDPELLTLAQQLIAALGDTAAGKQALSRYNLLINGGQAGVIKDNACIEGGIHLGRQPVVVPADLEATLIRAQRALAILEEQAAGYTSLTIPVHRKIELEDKRREVAELSQRYLKAGVIQTKDSHTTDGITPQEPLDDLGVTTTSQIEAEQKLYSCRIIQVSIAQMFRIADLLTRPYSVKARSFYDAITDVSKMRRGLNKRTGFELPGLGLLRPIVQIREKFDRFWTPAIPDLRSAPYNNCSLCFIPYELNLSELLAIRQIAIPSIERIRQSIQNYQTEARLRIYTPGTGIIRINATLEFREPTNIRVLSQLVSEMGDLFFVNPEDSMRPYEEFFLDVIDEVSNAIFIDEGYSHEDRCWMPPTVEYSLRGETTLAPEMQLNNLAQLLYLAPGNEDHLSDLITHIDHAIRSSQWQNNRILAVSAQRNALFVVDPIDSYGNRRKVQETLKWLRETHELIMAAAYAQKAYIEEIERLFVTQQLDETWLPEGNSDNDKFSYLSSLLCATLKVTQATACIPSHLHRQGGSMIPFAREIWLSLGLIDAQRYAEGFEYILDWLESQKASNFQGVVELKTTIRKILAIPPLFRQ